MRGVAPDPENDFPAASSRQNTDEDSFQNVLDEVPESVVCSSLWDGNVLIDTEDISTTKMDMMFRWHSHVLDFWLRHKVTDSAMNDLLMIQNAPYRTWSRVRDVLYESEDVQVDRFYMCAQSHKHLRTLTSGEVELCDIKNCEGKVKQFGYIRIWERIKARLSNTSSGPGMVRYYHEELKIISGNGHATYRDVFSGSVFRDTANRLGGLEAVKNDIFLIVSGDGAQPYRSTTYDMWPFVCMIANLAPCDRVKTKNMLPIMCVPGPNQPKDLIYFLEPFLQEMEKLSKGIPCRRWDGNEVIVRCHILLLEGDLAALCKLCCVKGYNGLRGCMYCLIKGICVRHTYFPSFERDASGRRRVFCRSDDLPMRNEAQTENDIRQIEYLRHSVQRGSQKEMNQLCKSSGINGESSLFSRSALIPYRSVPLD